MTIENLVSAAKTKGASDIHLEPGLPVTLRVSSGLFGGGPVMSDDDTSAIARELIGDKRWPEFLQNLSVDLAKTIEGVRCRLNIFHTSEGVGMAVRLLSSFVPTVDKLNLHPDLKKLSSLSNGLVLVGGSTGSGKSSTLAALIQEINQSEARHIITLEYPIEFQFKSQLSFIRQREIGRDAPSMQRALVDAMREDPDVLMVGEMREADTMRLTLNASETGHLVFSTIHSSTAVEALQRMISAFPSEIQNSVAAQLADSLAGVVCQRLRFREDLGIRLPECEVLRPTLAVRNCIRRGEFQQIASAMETGADDEMWTLARYRDWMAKRNDWYVSAAESE